MDDYEKLQQRMEAGGLLDDDLSPEVDTLEAAEAVAPEPEPKTGSTDGDKLLPADYELHPDAFAPDTSVGELRAAAERAKNTTPEQANVDDELALRYDLPKPVVAEKRDELKTRAIADDLVDVTDDAPATRKHFSDPHTLAIGKDHVAAFAKFERNLYRAGREVVERVDRDKNYDWNQAVFQQAERFMPNLNAASADAVGYFYAAINGLNRFLEKYTPLQVPVSHNAQQFFFDLADEHRATIDPPVQPLPESSAGDIMDKWNRIAATNPVANDATRLQLPERLQGDVADNWGLMKDPAWVVYNFGEVAPSVAAMLAGTILSGGNPMVGGMVAGGMEASSHFRELVEKHNVPENEALLASAQFGVVVAYLNKIGLTRVFSKYAPMPWLRRAGHTAVTAGIEGVTEWAEEPFQALFTSLATGKNVEDSLELIAKQSRAGFNVVVPSILMGGLMQSGGSATNWALHRRALNKMTEGQKAILAVDTLAQDVADGELPVKYYQSAVKAALKDAPKEVKTMYVDAAAFLRELGDNAEAVGVDLGIDLQSIQEEAQRGGFLEIPMERYAATISLNPEHHEALARHRKLSVDAYTLEEAEEAQRLIAEQTKEAIEGYEAQLAFNDETAKQTKEVAAEFTQMVKDSGKKFKKPQIMGMLYATRLAISARSSGGKYSVRDLHEKLGYGEIKLTEDGVRASLLHNELADGTPVAASPEAHRIATEEWYEQGVDSSLFKHWFNQSAIVDDAGEPMMLAVNEDSLVGDGVFLTPVVEGVEGDEEAYAALQNPIRVSVNEVSSPTFREDLASRGYDGALVVNEQGEVVGVYALNRDQVKILPARNKGGGRTFHQSYNALDDTQRTVVDQHLQNQPDAGLSQRMHVLMGTAWERQVTESILIRRALDEYMAGREPEFGNMLSNSGHPAHAELRELLLNHGAEGVWAYLASRDFMGFPAKSKRAVPSSYTTCNPSKGCASFCYAANGRTMPAVLIKQELNQWAVENDPARAAKMTAKEYSESADYVLGKALRLFDRGDISEAWLPYIDELNRLGVRVQIFSKNPDILRQVSDLNVRMLSVDSTNLELADQNPDLPLAVTYRGVEDLAFVETLESRFAERGGSILPLKGNKKSVSSADILSLPAWTQNHICLIDSGAFAVKGSKEAKAGKPVWDCTRCDARGGHGCFFGQSAGREEILKNLEKPQESMDDIFGKLRAAAADAGGSEGVLAQLDTVYAELRKAPNAGAADGTDNADDRDSEVQDRSGGKGRTFYQSERAELNRQYDGFFSPLEQAIADIDFREMPPAQLLARLKKTNGVKQEELDDLGFDDWLLGMERDGKVSKELVMDFVKTGGVRLEEVGATNDPDSVPVPELSPLEWEDDSVEGHRIVGEYVYLNEDAEEESVLYEVESYLETDHYGDPAVQYRVSIDNSVMADGGIEDVEAAIMALREEVMHWMGDDVGFFDLDAFEASQETEVVPLEIKKGRGMVGDESYDYQAYLNDDGYVHVDVARDDGSVDSLASFIHMEDAIRHAEENLEGELEFAVDTAREEGGEDTTKYRDYSSNEIGGDNYTELKVVADANPVGGGYIIKRADPTKPESLLTEVHPDNVHLAKQELAHTIGGMAHEYEERYVRNFETSYASPHWGESDVLLHLRTWDTYPDNDGKGVKKTYLVDEIQSDWQRDIRTKGTTVQPSAEKSEDYVNAQLGVLKMQQMRDEVKARIVGYERQLAELSEEQRAGFRGEAFEEWIEAGKNALYKYVELLTDARIRSRETRRNMHTRAEGDLRDGLLVPDAPLKKGWVLLALKAALRNAVHGGYDQMSWTTGETQAKRYNLDKFIQSVTWEKITPEGNIVEFRAQGHNGHAVYTFTGDVTKLDAVVGKELREKVQAASAEGGSLLAGLDLRVGGEGMRRFYDGIVRKELTKYLKKLDPSVKPKLEKIASHFVDNPNETQETAWTIQITEKIKAALRKGQTLYQDGEEKKPRGASHFGDTIFDGKSGKPLLELFERADQSTIAHELAHYFLELSRYLALEDGAHSALVEEWEAMKKALKLTDDGMINEEAHELFATEFEKYLAEGKAPSLALREVFTQFKAWMRAIYQSLITGGDFTPSPEMKALFDRMLATEQELAEVREVYDAAKPFFEEAEITSPEQRRKYKEARKKAELSEDEKHFRKIWKAFLKALGGKKRFNEEAKAEVNAMPVYLAINAIRGKYGKIDPVDMDALLGRDKRKELEGKMPHLLKKGGRIILAETAEEFGYDNPMQMVNAILAAQPKDELIKERADQTMAAEEQRLRESGRAEGELLGDDTYHNTARLTALIAEYQMVEDKTIEVKHAGEFKVPQAVAREAKIKAQEAVDKMLAAYTQQREQGLREYVDETVDGMPLYRMIAALQYDPIDLNQVKEAYGAAEADRVRKTHKGILKVGGGGITALAAKYGYANGKEFFDALANSVAIKDYKAQMYADLYEVFTTQDSDKAKGAYDRVYQAFVDQDPRTKQALSEHNDRILDTTGRSRLDAKAIKEVARETILATAINAATPRKYLAAERKAAKAARKLKSQGDMEGAMRQKRKEILNHALAMEALRVRDEVRINIGKLKLPKKANMDDGFYHQLRNVLARFGMASPVPIEAGRKPVPTLREFLLGKGTTKAGEEPLVDTSTIGIPAWWDDKHKAASEGAGVRSVLTVGELEELVRVVEYLKDSGEAAMKGTLAAFDRTSEDMAGNASLGMATLKNKRIIEMRSGTMKFLRSASDYARSAIAVHEMFPFILDSIDGYVNTGKNGHFGFARENFGNTLAERQSLRDEMKMEAGVNLQDILAPLKARVKAKGEAIDVKVPLPELLRKAGEVWTYDKVVAVVLNMGTETNMRRLIDGYGLTEEQLQELASYLSREELAAIQRTWDYIGTFWDALNAQNKRVYHHEKTRVKAKPIIVTSSEGIPMELKGGYYPIKYSPKYARRVAKWTEKDDLLQDSVHGHPNVQDGMLQDRAEKVTLPLDLSLGVLYRHLDTVIHFITHADVIRDIDRITREPVFRDMFIEKFGVELYDVIRPILRNIAKPDTRYPHRLEKTFTVLRTLSTAFILGWNASVASKQWFSTGGAWTDIGFGAWLDGVGEMTTDWHKSKEEMYALSPYMKTRATNMDKDAAEAVRLIPADGLSKERRQQLRDSSFCLIRGVDFVTVFPIWRGSFRQGLVKFDGDIPKAVRYADEMVRQSQPSSKPYDLSILQSQKHGAAKLFTMFMTFTMKYGGRQRYFYRAWRNDKITHREYMQHVMIEGVLMPMLMNAMFQGIWWDDDEDFDWISLLVAPIAYQFIGLVGVRDVASAGIARVMKHTLGRKNVYTPEMARTPALVGVKVAEDVLRDVSKLLGDLGDEKTQKRALWSLINLASYSYGTPIPKGIERVLEGYRQHKEEDGTWAGILIPDPAKRER